MRGNGKITGHSHHRSALPGRAFVFAGKYSAAGRCEPGIAGEIQGKNPTIHSMQLIIYALFDVDPRSSLHLRGGLRTCVGDCVSWQPSRGIRIEREDPAVGAGDDGALGRLRKREDIPSIKTAGKLLPSHPIVNRDKYTPERLVI